MLTAAQKQEIREGARQGILIALVVVAVGLAGAAGWRAMRASVSPAPAVATLTDVPGAAAVGAASLCARSTDFQGADVPDDVRTRVTWAVSGRDHRHAPFAVVDKRRTHLYVFDGSGRLQGDSPVLLGYAAGDDSVPGIGQRPIAEVMPSERTTPAGRFESRSGRNTLASGVAGGAATTS